MRNKELIRTEIEKLKGKYYKRGEESDAKQDGYGMYWGGVCNCLNEVLTLIDSIPQEPVSEDLEQEIQRHLKDCLDVKFPTTDIESIKKDVEFTARHFAKWQEEKDKELLGKEGLVFLPEEHFEHMKRSLIELSEWKHGLSWKEGIPKPQSLPNGLPKLYLCQCLALDATFGYRYTYRVGFVTKEKKEKKWNIQQSEFFRVIRYMEVVADESDGNLIADIERFGIKN